MILDERNEFCDATALNTGAAGATLYLLGDQIPLGSAAGGDIGLAGQWLVIQVTTAITATNNGTLELILASDSTASIATNGDATEHATYGPFATDDVTTIPAGTVLVCAQLPAQGNAYEAFLGILQRSTTTAISAGAINAFLTPDPSRWRAYPNAI